MAYTSASAMVNRCITLCQANALLLSDMQIYVPQLVIIIKDVLQELTTDPLISGADQAVIQNQLNISVGDQG